MIETEQEKTMRYLRRTDFTTLRATYGRLLFQCALSRVSMNKALEPYGWTQQEFEAALSERRAQIQKLSSSGACQATNFEEINLADPFRRLFTVTG